MSEGPFDEGDLAITIVLRLIYYLLKGNMFHQHKQRGKVINFTDRHYDKSRYRCKVNSVNANAEEGNVICSRTVNFIHTEDRTFPLEDMVIIDETDENLANESAAIPASCDSSDSEVAISSSGFQTDIIFNTHSVIFDNIKDNTGHPASPASCDAFGSELAPSTPATVKIIDEQPKKKKARMETSDQVAPISPLSVSSCSSSNSAPEAEHFNEESKEPFGLEHSQKIGNRKQKDWQETLLKPVKSNQDVFQFLKNFEVTNESDVTFAVKIAEMFSRALHKYREEKLEEIVCTEAEHNPTEELCMSPHAASSSIHDLKRCNEQLVSKLTAQVVNDTTTSPTSVSLATGARKQLIFPKTPSGDAVSSPATAILPAVSSSAPDLQTLCLNLPKQSLDISSSEQMHSSTSQATANSEFIRSSCSNSSRNSSPTQWVSHYTPSTDCQPFSSIQQTSSSSHFSNIASNSLRSPTNVNVVTNSLNKPSATNSTADYIHANNEADVLIDNDNCLTAEAACSDDDYV
ncbi:uncharacterized protein LOC142158610 isoform X2 [Mixophyes fleayi]|uniref:uncharacterized protein LOC142158610 isoform X2 n=1 Tax=Mixophyes fleayi TaxID=3061075 RepID=UPI003F4D77CA